jgi:hypothetical protein
VTVTQLRCAAYRVRSREGRSYRAKGEDDPENAAAEYGAQFPRSLADELVDCPALRASLWPAAGEPEEASAKEPGPLPWKGSPCPPPPENARPRRRTVRRPPGAAAFERNLTPDQKAILAAYRRSARGEDAA